MLLKLGVHTLAKLRCQQKTPAARFEEAVRSFLRPDHLVLDAGCGAVTRATARGNCRMIVGVDADQRISSNPGVDELVIADLSRLPFRGNTFDVVMSWMVVEHLDNPQGCFAELSRVCRQGAVVIISTPNVLHYANLIVKVTPYALHEWFIKHFLAGEGGESCPTRYRVNTPGKLARSMESEGFTSVEMRCIDVGPQYLGWLAPFYAVGLVYHRLVNRFDKLSSFRGIIIGVFRR